MLTFHPYRSPVVTALALPDEMLKEQFERSRRIHREVQSDILTGPEHEMWKDHLPYLMLVGDCAVREMRRRGEREFGNLILEHPINPVPEYWKRIAVPEWLTEEFVKEQFEQHKDKLLSLDDREEIVKMAEALEAAAESARMAEELAKKEGDVDGKPQQEENNSDQQQGGDQDE